MHTRCGGVVGFVYVLLAWATNLTVHTLPKQTRTEREREREGEGGTPYLVVAADLLFDERRPLLEVPVQPSLAYKRKAHKGQKRPELGLVLKRDAGEEMRARISLNEEIWLDQGCLATMENAREWRARGVQSAFAMHDRYLI